MLRPRRRSPRAFGRDRSGVSAVEFALLLPVILALWAGMAEMSHAIIAWRRVTLLARTVADLTAKGDASDPIATATMTDILAASKAVMLPFSGSNANVVVSALGVDLAGQLIRPRVCSSVASSNAQARTTGLANDIAIPAGYNVLGNRYILAEVSMPYKPMIGSALTNLVGGINGTITLSTSFAWPVRNGFVHNSSNNSPEVVMPSGSPCP